MTVGIIVITSFWTKLPSSSPTNATDSASLYSRASLVLPQQTDPGLRLFQVLPQGFPGEKPGGMEPGLPESPGTIGSHFSLTLVSAQETIW